MKKLLFCLMILTSCSPDKKAQEEEQTLPWYKGNTHTHTTLCGHADSHPDTVARWYLERDYNFLILSEHNLYIDPKTVNLPKDRRADFILIPGEEVTDHQAIHTTAMNISRLVRAQRQESEGLPLIDNEQFANHKIYLMQKHADSIRGAGGIPILNHPNFVSGAAASYIEKVKRLNMIELYNGHPDVYNWGNEQHASMEQKWDSLLTAGRRIYGVSSDDAHSFKNWGVDVSNPGRGWVMVQSEALTADAITAAMTQGNFYASSGVILSEVEVEDGVYNISVDESATYQEVESPYVVGFKLKDKLDGFAIEFISDQGTVLKKTNGLSASFDLKNGTKYVRAKVTLSRNRGSDTEQFFAWSQPVFLQ